MIQLEQFIERELKILITKEAFEKILNSYEFKKPVEQTNTYYDSSDEFLKKQKGAMRIRTIQDKKIFTLKIRKDEVTHYEYEKEIDVDTIQEIQDKEIQKWLTDFNKD